MKVGDLVRWTNPGCEDTGIVLKPSRNCWDEPQVIIHWFGCPEHSGPYPPNHKFLEVINESR